LSDTACAPKGRHRCLDSDAHPPLLLP